MASVRQRRESRFWTACITLPDGRKRQFSTGLEDRAEALAVATAAERACRRHEESPHQVRAALDRLAEEFTPAEDINPGPWLRAWAEGRKREVSIDTFRAYASTMTEAAGWLAWREIRRFSALTPRVLIELRDWWAERNSATTANKKIKHLRIGLGAAVREKRIESNPAAEVPALRAGANPRREFRPAEIDLLLGTLTGEWRALFLLGLYTGQRLNDLAEIRWRNLDLAGGSIAFTARKTGATVALPLVSPAIDALLALPAADDPDAPVFREIAAMARSSRSNAFRGLLEAAGLTSPQAEREGTRSGRRQTQPLSFHSLRHTATSLLKAAGVSDSIARAIVGHESPAVSRQYTHLDMDTMRQAIEKIVPK